MAVLPTLTELQFVAVWKFHDFAITKILREINLGHSKIAKSVILTNSEALNFDFYEFLRFMKDEIYQINKSQKPKIAKTAFSELQNSPKLILRKN